MRKYRFVAYRDRMMLILTRKRGEIIRIGGEVVVTVLSVNKHGQVRIGIDAPKEVTVHREEIYQKEQEKK